MGTIDHGFAYYFYLFISFTVITLVLNLFIKKLINYCAKTRHPPSPIALPIIGHLHLLSSRLPKSLASLASQYGPLMQIRFGSTPVLVVSSGNIAKEIMRLRDVDFASKYSLGFGLSQFDIYDGLSFVNCEYGPYWRFMKKMCATQLFAGVQLQRFIHIREQETLKLLKSLVNKSKEGEPCDLDKELQALANNIICWMAIGKRCAEKPNLPAEIRELLMDIMKYAAKISFIEVFGPLKRFDLSGSGKRLVSATWEYDRLMELIMEKYENTSNSCEDEGKDVMDILLETSIDDNAELKLTRMHIKKFFLEICFAAVDTIAATIKFAVAELMNNVLIFKKLREEIDSVVGHSRLMNEADVPKLSYLQAIIKETLRMHPAAPLIRRQSNIDSKINGYEVKAGARIIINAYDIMRDPNIWERHDEFLPERFLVKSSSGGAVSVENGQHQMDFRGGQDFHFLPFGSGRRACPGISHALIVAHTTIGALVQCFDWELKDADKNDMVKGYLGAMTLPFMCYPITRFDPSNASC